MARLARGTMEPGPARDAAIPPTPPRPQEERYGFRVTALRMLEQCPDLWAHSYERGAPRTTSRASRIGDAVHASLERMLRATSPDLAAEAVAMVRAGVPPREAAAAVDYYVDTLAPLGPPLAVEAEFREETWPGGPEIVGHVDCAFDRSGTILLVDHKTDRRDPKGVAEWSRDIQPLGYSWWARRRWPGARVWYRVGYVNMGILVEWEVPPSAETEFVARVRAADGAVQAHRAAGHWPRTAGAGCRFCPMRKGCEVGRAEGEGLLAALTGPTSGMTP